MKHCFVLVGLTLLICSCNSKTDNAPLTEVTPIVAEETTTQEVVLPQTIVDTRTAIETEQQSAPQKTLHQMVNGLPNNINLLGVWQMMPQAYTALYQQNGRYYMQDIYMDKCTYGDKEQLIKLSSRRFRYADDTGEVFEIADGVMNGYSYGDLACQWTQVM